MKNRIIDFINRSNIIHNNKYDYSLVEYKNTKTKVKIICPIHGIFEQIPNSHLKGHGCKLCGFNDLKLNKDDVINKLKNIHNNKYNYSLLNFNKNNDKVKIICPVHGEFEQILSDHLNGCGCKKCNYNTKINNLNEFILESNIIHNNKYDYSLVNYINNKTKVKIICPVHGEFEQIPNSHLRGHGCKLCAVDNSKSNLTEFIEKSNKIHNNKYNYDLSKYINSNNKITINCPIHGNFQQKTAGHLQGFGCYKCNISKGEKEIKKFFIEKNIIFEEQKIFEKCKNINCLKYDFYLPNYNTCIEYDGEYHYKNIFNNDEYLKQKHRDNIKDEYCIKNNIKLIRIPYYNFKNIYNILNNLLINKSDKDILFESDPSGKYTKENYLKEYHIDLYNIIINYSISNNIENIPFKQKVYCYKYNIVPPTCSNPNCNNTVNFKNSTIGYKKYCSTKCVSNDPNIQKIKENKSLEKYGTKTPSESQVIKNKIIETNNQLYGCNSPLQNKDIKQKSLNTLMSNYGVNNLNKNSEIVKKRVNTFKQNSKQWRLKFENTMVERYGVKNALQNDTIKLKTKETILKKYNVENVNQNDIINKKRISNRKENWKYDKLSNIILEKYGVKNIMEIDEYREKSRYNRKNNEKKVNTNILDIDLDNNLYLMKCDCGKEHNFNITFSLYKSRKQFCTKFCTVCYPPYKNNISQLESNLFNFIKENYNNDIILNSKSIISPYELDIYLPNSNLAFEFNGIYWHNELNKSNNYHKMKTDLCLKQNIQLIHVYEDDWNFKQDIVKSMILNKLNKSDNKIFARKTKIIEITDNDLIRNFLDNNHIQGFVGSGIKIGLFYNNELVSLMTFGKLRKSMNSYSHSNNEYEMLRFCNKLNTNVIGGASKLFKYFIDIYKPNKVVSYADRSYSNGNLYKQLGFELNDITEPNYYYVVNDIRKYRYNYRKDILVKEGFDPNKSEHDIMLERKIYRIYNSGNYKFIHKS